MMKITLKCVIIHALHVNGMWTMTKREKKNFIAI